MARGDDPLGLDAETKAVVAYCKEAMRRGSLSFYLASRLAGRRLSTALLLLYAWCRYCDDVIDQEDAALGSNDVLARLADLRRRTAAAMAPNRLLPPPTSQTADPGAAVFSALALLSRHYHIPAYYPDELLAGMEMDLAGYSYQTFADLRLYAYRVASTVGLMFSHLAGIDDERALKQAADLGTAMQLTNIARDVLTDAGIGRVYLPAEWLKAEGLPLTPGELSRPVHRPALARVVARLLAEADGYYRSGQAGLRHLPLSAAFAAAAARYIYAEIGVEVLRRGPRAWNDRVVISLPRKLMLVCKGAVLVLKTFGSRLKAPWRPVVIQTLWRFPS